MNQTITRDKLVRDVKEVISDAEALIRVTADDLGEKAKDARSKLSDRLETAKGRLHEVEDVLRDKAMASAKETDRVIRDHPYESLGVAFGIGLLVGILLNRK